VLDHNSDSSDHFAVRRFLYFGTGDRDRVQLQKQPANSSHEEATLALFHRVDASNVAELVCASGLRMAVQDRANASSPERTDSMKEFKLKRGGREVVFKENKSQFGVRLQQGHAASDAELRSTTGRPVDNVRHVARVRAENIDVFAVPPGELDSTMTDLRNAPATSVVTHTYTMEGDPNVLVPTGAITVQFKPGVPDEQREAILAKHGLEIVRDLDFLANGYTVRLTTSSTENPLKIAAKLQKEATIATAEPDFSFQRALKMSVPTDTEYPQQWHLRNRGDQLGLVAGADCKAEGAWEITLGTRNIVVCVIDDGFDVAHPDFASSGKIVSPRDFGQNDTDPNPVASTDNHGTSCAGVAIADRNGTGVVGLAPGCAFMPVRMAEWLSDDTVVAMFQHAMDRGADVISCSWSAAAPYFPLSTKMTAILTKVATQGRRNGKGCVILFAAGNENAPLDATKDGVRYHQGFALHPNVIAVAASNSLDKRSDYSNFGPHIAICAPSSGSPGRRVVTTDRQGAAGYGSSSYTDSFGGTSSSTPLTAGLAALVLSVDPNLTSAQVKRLIMDNADKIDTAGGDYNASGHSQFYGHGRINAAKTVLAASGTGVAKPLPKTLAMEHRIQRPLPDEKKTEDRITFPLDVKPLTIEVSLEVRHTFVGDLRISVTAPNGKNVVLLDQEGGTANDIVRAFRSTDAPNRFEAFLGTSAKGDWIITVEDLAPQDEGVLVRWGVAIGYEN